MDMHNVVDDTVDTVVVGKANVSPADVIAVARGNARIALAEDSLAEMAGSRARIDALAAEPRPVYGI